MFAGQPETILGMLLSIIHVSLGISLEQNKELIQKQWQSFSF